MIRLVLDPGVLVSAAIAPSGTPARLLALVREGVADVVISPALIEELAAVLARPKFRRYLSLKQAEQFVVLIERLAIKEADAKDPPHITRDPADDYLIALAQSARAVAIVSGDKDLLALGTLTPPTLSPRETWERLTREGIADS